ncbi:alpha-tocopherol transfer protein-like isoform X2 [Nylanderia fulva]|uniref:alpha-tocopherol transfer protein-like isoform X2 n=1 Tax=Nylanderia fulva TaxID=613905 RepID=UPI0010FB9CF4|nr:alpha-tocopherol transfer protein-like isoform X2 [Nylanderia fulva]
MKVINHSIKKNILDEFFILRFLRVCKFDTEKAKTRIQNFQKVRFSRPEWCSNLDPLQPRLQELLSLGICLPLRKLDNQGRMVFIVRASYDPDVFTISEGIKILILILEVAFKDNVEASLYGLAVIMDFQHATLRHIAQLRPNIVWHLVHGVQGCYPIRIRSLNSINTPEYAKFVMTIARYFLNNKLKERFHVYSHKTTHDCLKNVPANILPIEYGGTDGTTQELIEYWQKVVEENREYFIDDENYKPILK